MIIYKAENKVNKKIYIGQTKNSLSHRIKGHKCDATTRSKNIPWHNALRKYGVIGFDWSVICECETQEELDEMEFHYIKQYKSFKAQNGYNVDLGGFGVRNVNGDKNPMFNKKHTDDVKMKISKANKGKMVGDINPSKRPEVRECLSKEKMGLKNPNGKVWKLIDPSGEEFIIEGGIKRNLKFHGLDYQTIWIKYRGEYKGYILLQLS